VCELRRIQNARYNDEIYLLQVLVPFPLLQLGKSTVWGEGGRRNFISFGTEVFRNLISLSFADNSETEVQKDDIDLEITLKMRDKVEGGRSRILASIVQRALAFVEHKTLRRTIPHVRVYGKEHQEFAEWNSTLQPLALVRRRLRCYCK